ncbi:MAG: glycosyltransferase family 2 protein [Bacteroidales bacterium]|nr:glycosyltransferase family 2 protein [Bacteroidales bacterium]
MYTPNLISIIVPCYNVGEYLSETLDSVISQTYSKWECIIINDGSTDNTEIIAKEYCNKSNKFKYIYQDNAGVSVARNKGIKESIGEYILPLDGDDIIDNSFLDKSINYIIKYKETKLVYSKVEMFGAEQGEFCIPEYNYNNFIWGNCIVVTALFKHSDFDKTPGFNPNMREGLEDWDFWLTFLSPEDIVHRINEPLLKYRIRNSSRTRTSASEHEKELLIKICENHPDIYKKYAKKILLFKSIIDQKELALEKLKYKLSMDYIEILNSTNYRLGKYLLSPFRFIHKIIKK